MSHLRSQAPPQRGEPADRPVSEGWAAWESDDGPGDAEDLALDERDHPVPDRTRRPAAWVRLIGEEKDGIEIVFGRRSV